MPVFYRPAWVHHHSRSVCVSMHWEIKALHSQIWTSIINRNVLTGKDSLFHKCLREVRALLQHFYHQKFAVCTSIISKTLNYIRKHLFYPQQIAHIHLNYASGKLSTEVRHMDFLNLKKPFWSLKIHRVDWTYHGMVKDSRGPEP